MFGKLGLGKLLGKLGLGPAEAAVADTVLERVADRATGGAASRIEDAAEAIGREVKRRAVKRSGANKTKGS